MQDSTTGLPHRHCFCGSLHQLCLPPAQHHTACLTDRHGVDSTRAEQELVFKYKVTEQQCGPPGITTTAYRSLY